MFKHNFAIVDIETTGGHPLFHRVIEVGLLRIEKGEVVQTYKTLVNPGRPIPEWITGITGITDDQVINAPSFEDIKDELIELFEDAIFVAHNSSFDYGFLQKEFERVDRAFTVDSLCTVRLSRAMFPGFRHHNLTALIERFKFDCANRHRAFDDAKVLWDFLQILPEKFPQEQIDLAVKRCLQKIAPAKQRKIKPDFDTELRYVYEDC
jgi:DNA polymerase III subunit epsilon